MELHNHQPVMYWPLADVGSENRGWAACKNSEDMHTDEYNSKEHYQLQPSCNTLHQGLASGGLHQMCPTQMC